MASRSLFLLVVLALSADASVTAIRVTERSDVLGGKSFGAAGPYERIIATAHFAVDPKLPQNRLIRDIDLAPTNADGLVEFSADLYVLKPRDPATGNGTVLLEILNRGRKLMLQRFLMAPQTNDPRTAEDFGDAFLLEQGFTLAWIGWQFDLPETGNLMRLQAPVAVLNGKPVTGLVRLRFAPARREQSLALESYPVADGAANLKVYVRDSSMGPAREVPRRQWKLEGRNLVSSSGFEPGKIYDVVYTGTNSVPAGLGMAAVRDIVSYLKYGVPQGGIMPLGDQRRFIKRAMGFGISQSGRFLRHFLYEGFNEDEKGRQVFDGVWSDVAGAGRGSFNHRFAQPGRMDGLYPIDMPPFHSWTIKLAPKLFLTNTSAEYWSRAASLIHTTSDGRIDIKPDATTRIYVIAGGEHGPGRFPPVKEGRRYAGNPADYSPLHRALLVRLHEWIRDGKEPPPSQYPQIAKNELVPFDKLAFPKLQGVTLPSGPYEPRALDYGPEFLTTGVITQEPPAIGSTFGVRVPQCDDDGIDLGGIRIPEVSVPLGTYTGWNLPANPASTRYLPLAGSWFPFARTKAERAKTRDPRRSIEERYQSREEYLRKVEAAARELATAGFLLDRDIDLVVARSRQQWDHLMNAK
ncbi:MAG: hypothetical protein IRZ15_07530 [Bryobacteraceae bacterium]|nr:hypothetical protein [Bryobacteraceae bacterium]